MGELFLAMSVCSHRTLTRGCRECDAAGGEERLQHYQALRATIEQGNEEVKRLRDALEGLVRWHEDATESRRQRGEVSDGLMFKWPSVWERARAALRGGK